MRRDVLILILPLPLLLTLTLTLKARGAATNATLYEAEEGSHAPDARASTEQHGYAEEEPYYEDEEEVEEVVVEEEEAPLLQERHSPVRNRLTPCH